MPRRKPGRRVRSLTEVAPKGRRPVTPLENTRSNVGPVHRSFPIVKLLSWNSVNKCQLPRANLFRDFFFSSLFLINRGHVVSLHTIHVGWIYDLFHARRYFFTVESVRCKITCSNKTSVKFDLNPLLVSFLFFSFFLFSLSFVSDKPTSEFIKEIFIKEPQTHVKRSREYFDGFV